MKIDEVAKRILTLGHAPNHNFTDYAGVSEITETKEVSDGTESVGNILQSLKTIIIHQRELLALSAEAGDEGTNALMSDYILTQEKLVWKYSAFLDQWSKQFLKIKINNYDKIKCKSTMEWCDKEWLW